MNFDGQLNKDGWCKVERFVSNNDGKTFKRINK